MKKFIQEFKTFALRGNMMDMAVGVIIGSAFSGIVTSLTDNFINPILNIAGQFPYHGICIVLSAEGNQQTDNLGT